MNSEEEKTKEEKKEEEETGIKEEAVKPPSKSPLDSFIKLSVATGILLVSLSISYYFLLFPNCAIFYLTSNSPIQVLSPP